MVMKRYIMPALLASLLATGACYADAKTPAANNQQATNLVNKLTKGQATIVKSFPSLGNLQGYVVKPSNGQKGQPTVIYVDKNGQYAVIGVLLAADGENQSTKDNQQYIVSDIAQQALADAKNTAWVLDGKADAKHVTYAVADPNCSYCNKLYEVTRPYVKSGDLAIRWIWVGFLRDTSPGLAQAILAAKDPAQAMAQDEGKFDPKSGKSGLAPLTNPSKEVADKFKKNMDFIGKYQFPGTPVLIFRDQSGTPQASFGLPVDDQLANTINSMGTL
jgi:thiol:disulfide interchange protein DsbG